jgi:hypothetical protein
MNDAKKKGIYSYARAFLETKAILKSEYSKIT